MRTIRRWRRREMEKYYRLENIAKTVCEEMDLSTEEWDEVAEAIERVPTEGATMARWFIYEDDTPQCSSCGMWMPFARYRRGQGTDARDITDYCPHCGKKMTAMPMCGECSHGNGEWKDDGICYACREQVWIPGRPHRKAGEEH